MRVAVRGQGQTGGAFGLALNFLLTFSGRKSKKRYLPEDKTIVIWVFHKKCTMGFYSKVHRAQKANSVARIGFHFLLQRLTGAFAPVFFSEKQPYPVVPVLRTGSARWCCCKMSSALLKTRFQCGCQDNGSRNKDRQ